MRGDEMRGTVIRAKEMRERSEWMRGEKEEIRVTSNS